MPLTTVDVMLADDPPAAHRPRRGALLVAAFVGVAATMVVLGLIAATFDLRVARVKTVDVYVTAVDADQTSIGYATSAKGDVLGTYDLRRLDVWADGEHGDWIPVGSDVEHGHPSCIPPGSYGAKVRLTLVRTVLGSARVIDHVARLRCLSPASG